MRRTFVCVLRRFLFLKQIKFFGYIPIVKKLFVSISACFFCAIFISAQEQLFEDRNFAGGFRLSATDSRANPVEVGYIFSDGNSRPKWRLAQWGTNYSLEGVAEKNDGSSRTMENAGKLVQLRKDGKDTVLRLEIRAGDDYGGKLRKPGEAWPHLLIEQSFDALPKISEIKNFKVSYEVKISDVRAVCKERMDESLHAAQLVMFFTLQDRNKASAGYGDYIWFGLPIYDFRHDFPPAHKAVDAGKADATAKYIYAVDGRKLHRSKVRMGRWIKFDKDVLPLMKEALEDAFKKGYLKNSELKDIAISGMNTGWEMPGPFNGAAEYKNISATYEKKPARK